MISIWNESFLGGRHHDFMLTVVPTSLPDGADVVVKGLESNHVEEEARLFASGLHGEITRLT